MIEIISRTAESGVEPCVAERVVLSNGDEFYVSFSPHIFANGGTEAFRIYDGDIDFSGAPLAALAGNSINDVIDLLIEFAEEDAEPEEYDAAADPIYDRDFHL